MTKEEILKLSSWVERLTWGEWKIPINIRNKEFEKGVLHVYEQKTSLFSETPPIFYISPRINYGVAKKIILDQYREKDEDIDRKLEEYLQDILNEIESYDYSSI